MERRRVSLASLAVAALVLTGCPSEPRDEAPTPRGTPGKIVFDQQCSVCHGRTGKGDTMIASNYEWSDLTDGKWGYGETKEEITRTVVDGIPQTPMRGFKGALSDAEIAFAVDYILTLDANLVN